ncbi:unnamed protein product [Urochloa decumbens]|uniref:Uncharacterized protein n=1 Tax=Urochloa decumbens TaxID=240449 RepID=A0ABC9A6N9_9POAL
MGSASIYSRISKSMVEIKVHVKGEPIIRCGVIVVCKASSAYIIADTRELGEYVGMKRITVDFPDQQTSSHNQFFDHNGLLGIQCRLRKQFDHNKVSAVEFDEEALKSLDAVYVYEGVKDIITPGNVTQCGTHMFSVTNDASALSEFGAPILNKNGMFVGMCDSFGYHLSGRTILAIAETLEGSQNRTFTNVQGALDHLYDTI